MAHGIADDTLADIAVSGGSPIDRHKVETGQLVAVERDVEVGIPLQVAYQILGTDSQFDAFIDDLASVVSQTACRSTTGR